jgi:hypothetical protein
MSWRYLPVLALLFIAPTLGAKDKIIMPQAIAHATYVMVTTYDGDVFSPGLRPEDRQAVADVQKALENWGHYKLVYSAHEAELILVVRTGRAVEMRGGLQRGTTVGPGGAPGGAGQVVGAEVGDPQDTLEAFIAPTDIKTSTPLWRGRAVDGLKAPEMPLMKEFREKVEAAAAKKH